MKAMEAAKKKADEEAERLRKEVSNMKAAQRKAVASKQESGAGKGRLAPPGKGGTNVQRSLKLNVVFMRASQKRSGV